MQNIDAKSSHVVKKTKSNGNDNGNRRNTLIKQRNTDENKHSTIVKNKLNLNNERSLHRVPPSNVAARHQATSSLDSSVQTAPPLTTASAKTNANEMPYLGGNVWDADSVTPAPQTQAQPSRPPRPSPPPPPLPPPPPRSSSSSSSQLQQQQQQQKNAKRTTVKAQPQSSSPFFPCRPTSSGGVGVSNSERSNVFQNTSSNSNQNSHDHGSDKKICSPIANPLIQQQQQQQKHVHNNKESYFAPSNIFTPPRIKSAQPLVPPPTSANNVIQIDDDEKQQQLLQLQAKHLPVKKTLPGEERKKQVAEKKKEAMYKKMSSSQRNPSLDSQAGPLPSIPRKAPSNTSKDLRPSLSLQSPLQRSASSSGAAHTSAYPHAKGVMGSRSSTDNRNKTYLSRQHERNHPHSHTPQQHRQHQQDPYLRDRDMMRDRDHDHDREREYEYDNRGGGGRYHNHHNNRLYNHNRYNSSISNTKEVSSDIMNRDSYRSSSSQPQTRRRPRASPSFPSTSPNANKKPVTPAPIDVDDDHEHDNHNENDTASSSVTKTKDRYSDRQSRSIDEMDTDVNKSMNATPIKQHAKSKNINANENSSTPRTQSREELLSQKILEATHAASVSAGEDLPQGPPQMRQHQPEVEHSSKNKGTKYSLSASVATAVNFESRERTAVSIASARRSKHSYRNTKQVKINNNEKEKIDIRDKNENIPVCNVSPPKHSMKKLIINQVRNENSKITTSNSKAIEVDVVKIEEDNEKSDKNVTDKFEEGDYDQEVSIRIGGGTAFSRMASSSKTKSSTEVKPSTTAKAKNTTAEELATQNKQQQQQQQEQQQNIHNNNTNSRKQKNGTESNELGKRKISESVDLIDEEAEIEDIIIDGDGEGEMKATNREESEHERDERLSRLGESDGCDDAPTKKMRANTFQDIDANPSEYTKDMLSMIKSQPRVFTLTFHGLQAQDIINIMQMREVKELIANEYSESESESESEGQSQSQSVNESDSDNDSDSEEDDEEDDGDKSQDDGTDETVVDEDVDYGRWFDLNNNQIEELNGEMCEGFRRLRVSQLNLAYNKILDVPVEIERLRHSLRILTLCNNGIRYVPDNLQKLSALQVLDLSNNVIRVLPHNMQHLKRLEILMVNNNELEDLPEDLVGCGSQILALDISHNTVISQLPECLHHCTELCNLELKGTYLYGNLLSEKDKSLIHTAPSSFIRQFSGISIKAAIKRKVKGPAAASKDDELLGGDAVVVSTMARMITRRQTKQLTHRIDEG